MGNGLDFDYDFSGWATKNDLRCADGLTIRRDAFADQNGEVVPLVWSHQHNSPNNVLGHALLVNTDDGVYTFAKFNGSKEAQDAKIRVDNGDVKSLSIYANMLTKSGKDVMHGTIREVSLVLAGANPGAYIDNVIKHGVEMDDEAVICTGEDIILEHDAFFDDELSHSDDSDEGYDEAEEEGEEEMDGELDIQDVVDSMTDEQKEAMYTVAGLAAMEALDSVDDDDDDYEEDEEMKHNVFDTDVVQGQDYISHGDQEMILDLAKTNKTTFQDALAYYADENSISHDAIASGFVQPPASGNVTWLFPEYKDVKPGAPELITYDTGWVTTIMNKVHKSPISRIRTRQVDIRDIDELRAKGYIKGKQKTQTGNFNLVRRETDPQTIYVKSALHRDDIIDITDFDYVQYLYNIDRAQLNEEIATAIMFGDGREAGSDGKIDPTHIRPVYGDDPLYTIYADLNRDVVAQSLANTSTGVNFTDDYITAEAFIQTLLFARENFKGSGTPDMYITPHMLNVMLLARDLNGRRIYGTKAELASALDVGAIYTVEQMENKKRTITVEGSPVTKKCLAVVGNFADYYVGSTKGGEITHFTQFDIDFNQQKSLLETRLSGANTRVYSFIAIEETVNPN